MTSDDELIEYRVPLVMGQPMSFDTCMDVVFFCHMYLEDCSHYKVKATLTGLASALGMTRDDLLKYSVREKYADVINSYRMYVQQGYEEHLFGQSQSSGAIFALKNMGNSSFNDKRAIEYEGTLTVSSLATALLSIKDDDIIDADYDDISNQCVSLPTYASGEQSQKVEQSADNVDESRAYLP